MSEHSTPEERTEMPTSKRMSKLRSDGLLFHSQEVVLVLTLTTGFYMLRWSWGAIYHDLQLVIVKSYKMIGNDHELTTSDLHQGFLVLLSMLGPDIVLFGIIISLVACLGVFLQTNWNIKSKKFDFKWNKINLISGFRRIISIAGIITTLKAILKLSLMLPIGYFALKQFAPEMIALMFTSVPQLFDYVGQAMSIVFWKIMYVLIAMAIFDYSYGKYQWLRNNKMTKEEVKDERKAQEGDEATKRMILSEGMKRMWHRMQMAVRKADVIITNPTHYAVAIQYDKASMRAPVVVAKGRGFVALRIREIATENQIPVVERKPLARALFASCEVGSEIPYELYRAVAEVLAYVYRLRNPWAQHRKPTTSASAGVQQ